jgi:Spy/CpxP family protein refolding chaperone
MNLRKMRGYVGLSGILGSALLLGVTAAPAQTPLPRTEEEFNKMMGFTTAQKNKFAEINKKYNPQLQAIQTKYEPQVRKLQQQLVALQQKAQADAKPIMTKREAEIKSVLTPAQAAKLKDLEAQRVKMMQQMQQGGGAPR